MLGWCMWCHGPSDVTISVPGDRTILHYAACWDHLDDIVNRMRSDARRPRRPAVSPPKDTIDTTAENVAGELDR